MIEEFRNRVRAGEVVLGAFIKTAHHSVGEVMGRAGLDFAIIDAEHSPFDLEGIDKVVLGARAAGLPCLVRPAGHWLPFIGQCLDLGAAGVWPRMSPMARRPAPSQAPPNIPPAAAVSHPRPGQGTTELWSSLPTAPGLTPPRVRSGARSRMPRRSIVWTRSPLWKGSTACFSAAPISPCRWAWRDRITRRWLTPSPPPLRPFATTAGRWAHLADTGEIGGFLELGATVLVVGADQSWLMSQGRAIRQALTEATNSRSGR